MNPRMKQCLVCDNHFDHWEMILRNGEFLCIDCYGDIEWNFNRHEYKKPKYFKHQDRRQDHAY